MKRRGECEVGKGERRSEGNEVGSRCGVVEQGKVESKGGKEGVRKGEYIREGRRESKERKEGE